MPEPQGGDTVVKRFAVRFIAFFALIVPVAILMAMLASW